MIGRPVWLVAQREIRERTRSRVFRITTLVLLIGALAAVVIPSIVGGDDGPETVRVGVATSLEDLPAAFVRAGEESGSPVRITRMSAGVAERRVRDDLVDIAVVGPDAAGVARVVVREDLGAERRALVAAAIADARVRAALTAAGVAGPQIEAALAPTRLDVTATDPDEVSDDEGWIGVVTAVALVLALVFAGTVVASGVAEEKTTRISEVLLAAMSAGRLLLGKIIGVGVLILSQLLVVVVTATVAASLIGGVDIPSAAPVAVGAALLWFILGYGLYSAAFGALGALVARQQEVGMAIAPLSYLLWGGYFVVIFGINDVDALWFRVLSFVPLLSPMLMPTRMVTDTVTPVEVTVAVVLTVAFAAGLIWLGARVYRAGLTATGTRMHLGPALARAVRAGSD